MINKVVVDYGGSLTRAMAFDSRGKKLREFQAKSKPLPLLPKVLAGVFRGWKAKDIPRLVIGAKSIWSRPEKKWLHQRTRSLARQVTILSDIELAFLNLFSGKPGILILAGTGSICLGRNKKGKQARAGGLGPRVGDEGSGYWIGKMYNQFLQGRVKKKSVQEYAAMAPGVLQKAKAKDPLGQEIIRQAHIHLVRLVNSVRHQLEEKSLPLKLAGGLFENDYFRKGFLNLLRTADPAL